VGGAVGFAVGFVLGLGRGFAGAAFGLAGRFTPEGGTAFGGAARRGDGFAGLGLPAILARADFTRADFTRAGFTRAADLLRTAGLTRDFTAAADLITPAGFPDAAGLGAGACRAARAALTFFLACLAAFLLALASFRARFSTALARRTCFFAVSARADACVASDWSRCAAAASFARFVDADVATLRSRLKKLEGAVSLVP
jgi:hypothetical protein